MDLDGGTITVITKIDGKKHSVSDKLIKCSGFINEI